MTDYTCKICFEALEIEEDLENDIIYVSQHECKK